MFDFTFTWRTSALIVLGIVVLQAALLYLFGQPWICECGHVSLWAGEVFSIENSQQLADWYSFSHIIHGFIFYWLATLFFPKTKWYARLAMAVGIEVAWEVAENTPMVIDHYRQQALAQGYVGDSIINSLSDTLMMIGGFFLARKLPVWVTVSLALLMEVFVAYSIRDNLLLNVINLIYQFDVIKEWQSGA